MAIIIAFDGNVYTGKTGIIKKFCSEYKFSYIKEYSEYFQIKSLEQNLGVDKYLKRQYQYLIVDKLRSKDITSSKINLLDRSYISLSAHVLALYITYKIDIRKEFLGLLRQFINERKIILPNAFVYIKCELDCVKKRINQKGQRKNMPRFYIDKCYFKSIDYFNQRWSKIVKPWSMVIDTTNWREISFKKLISFIRSVGQIKPNRPSLPLDPKNIISKITDIFQY